MRNCSKSAARIGATSRRRWREDNPPSLAPSSPVSSRVSSSSSPARARGDGGLFALCNVSAPAAAAVALCPGCHASVIHASSSRGNLSCALALIHHHTASDMANETVVARTDGDGRGETAMRLFLGLVGLCSTDSFSFGAHQRRRRSIALLRNLFRSRREIREAERRQKARRRERENEGKLILPLHCSAPLPLSLLDRKTAT